MNCISNNAANADPSGGDGTNDDQSDRPASTCVSRVIRAPRKVLYQAFLGADAVAVARWLPPATLTGQVHAFEPREGGLFRVSLTYDGSAPASRGKTTAATDTFQGRFVMLVPDERIVQLIEFESENHAFAETMILTASLADVPDGTEVTILHENLPRGIRPADNEMGCRSSLENLAAYVE